MRRFLMVVIVLLALPAAATAADPLDGLTSIGRARVVEVIDGDTVVIDPAIGGLDRVRLVGIQAPKLPLGRPNFKAWPLARESKAALTGLVGGRMVDLYVGGAPVDRYGRHLAHLRRDDGLWIQGEMLRTGWARVYSFPDNRKLAAEMLALEREARAARAGIWGHPNYAVRRATPEALKNLIGRFEIVEGAVAMAEVHKGTGYINFGDNWRTDVTAVIARKALKVFRNDGIDIASYAGKRVRVRGWLKSFNGPMIAITHPEQIEVLP